LETRISVVIPTFGRPATLRDAIKSVAEQSIEPSRIQLIIIDNNPTDQERQAIASLEHLFANPIIYFHEPNAGLCNARNAGMAQVKSRYVAFLDDDMIASSSWLSSLLESTSRLGAGIVFGPTLARLPEDIPDPNGFMSRFFSRVLKNEKEKRVEKTLGAGGCLLDLSLCRLPKPAFDPALSTHGGEDDVLFEVLKRQGTLVGWSPDALSHEIVPRHRANAHYVVQTSFGFGQGPAQIYATRGPAGSLKIAFTMAKGGVQLLLHGVLAFFAFFAFIRRSPTLLRHMSRATQGLGKIF
jgi:glycosyltransferase involved in cell wall biosynthesis